MICEISSFQKFTTLGVDIIYVLFTHIVWISSQLSHLHEIRYISVFSTSDMSRLIISILFHHFLSHINNTYDISTLSILLHYLSHTSISWLLINVSIYPMYTMNYAIYILFLWDIKFSKIYNTGGGYYLCAFYTYCLDLFSTFSSTWNSIYISLLHIRYV